MKTAAKGTSPDHPWPMFPHPDGKDFVDFDEELQVQDILDVTVIRVDPGDVPADHQLSDGASAGYMWMCLPVAKAGFDGGPVGLATVRKLKATG